MGKALFAALGLVVGLVAGTVFGGSILGGAAAGAGIATGLSAGICSTVTAAREEGLLTEAEVAQVLTRAAADMGAEAPGDAALVASANDCAGVMDQLRALAAE